MTQEVRPDRITKPMQLLAAWLAGLIIIDTTFLASAKVLTAPPWLPIALALAAIFNVPLFLICFFLLQTRFRPEMQEDTYYSQYLQQARQTSVPLNVLSELATLRQEAAHAGTIALELVEGVQRQNDMIASQLNQLGAAQLLPISDESVAVAVESVRINTMSRLNEAWRDLHWSQARVAVNDLLPDFDALRSRLVQHGVPIRSTFGSNSIPAVVPRMRLLSVGPAVPVDRFQIVLRASAESVEFIQFGTTSDELGQIFIGSYGYEESEPHNRIAHLTPDIRAWLLQPGVALDDFVQTFQGEATGSSRGGLTIARN